MFFQFSRKDQGVYKAVLGDDRGKDTSVFDISGQGTFLTAQTDQLLYSYSHNQHVIMCFVSLCR